MRNRWIMAALVATAGLLASPVADRAKAQPTAWDVSGNEEKPLWAPVGTYQHDGSGFVTGVELVYLTMKRALGEQPIAYRGVVDNFEGQILGSREVALDAGDLGRTSWGAGYRVSFGYRCENGWLFSISWLHLFDIKYSGGAGPIGPNLANPGDFSANTFLTAPVYNFSPDFFGRNPFPNPPFTQNPTAGIWNGASDMSIVFTQRFDNWDLAGRFPVFETENARSYAIAGGRFSWIWERFQWRTVKPEVVDDGTGVFSFVTSPDSAARYLNTLSQRMYGPMVGVGHEVMLYAGPAGAFGFGTELTGAMLLNIGKERAKYIREDESTQVKRAWWEQTLTPNFNAVVNLTWQPFDGVQFRVGYNFLNYFNTKYMQEPVSFNAGALDPAYGTKFWRCIHGTNFGVAFTY
jgi:hypothetical protein